MHQRLSDEASSRAQTERLADTQAWCTLDEAKAVIPVSLKGPLAKYNGRLLREWAEVPSSPRKSASQRQYNLFFVDRDGGDKVEVVVPASALRGTKIAAAERKDGWAREQEKFEKQFSGSLALNNRSSVQVAVSHILSQMERKLQSKKAITDFFAGSDGEELDKPEFLRAMLVHGIQVTPRDVDLIFPLVDADGNGTVSIPEFVDYFQNHQGSQRNQQAHLATKKQRQTRIQKKTQLQKHLKRISEYLRAALVAHLEAHKLSADQLFERIDDDGSNTIDRMELTIALQALQINMTQRDVNIVWPLFTLDLFGNIGRKQWLRFIHGRDVSFQFTQDKYLEHLEDEEQVPSVVEAQRAALAKLKRQTKAEVAKKRSLKAVAAAVFAAPYHKPGSRQTIIAPGRGRTPALVAVRPSADSYPHPNKNKFNARSFKVDDISPSAPMSKQAVQRLAASPRSRMVRLKVVERPPVDPYRPKTSPISTISSRSRQPPRMAGGGSRSRKEAGGVGVGVRVGSGVGAGVEVGVGIGGSSGSGWFDFEVEDFASSDQRGDQRGRGQVSMGTPDKNGGDENSRLTAGQQLASTLAAKAAGATAAIAAMRQWQQEQEQEQQQAAVKEIVMAIKIARQAAIAAAFFADRASSVLYFLLQQQVRTPQLRQALIQSYLSGRKRMEETRPMPFPVRLNGSSTGGRRQKQFGGSRGAGRA
jgi:Ca2+-binding EF-hand superfamily protein